jgi:hypothetical protein
MQVDRNGSPTVRASPIIAAWSDIHSNDAVLNTPKTVPYRCVNYISRRLAHEDAGDGWGGANSGENHFRADGVSHGLRIATPRPAKSFSLRVNRQRALRYSSPRSGMLNKTFEAERMSYRKFEKRGW